MRVQDDAKRLADGFASFNAEDLQNLSAGEAIARVGKSEDDFSLTASSLRASNELGYMEQIIEYSRSQYGSKVGMQTEEEPPPTYTETPKPKDPTPPPPTPQPIEDKENIKGDEEKLKSFSPPKARTNHRYHQVLIKKMAEANGYKASIEMLTPNGKGKVDVLLEKGGKTIAVEVSDTTEASWELHNIEKCIHAGYTEIYCCFADPNTRRAVQKIIHELNPKPSNISIGTVEELLILLQTPEKDEEPENRMKGYRVNVQHRTLSNDEANTKRKIIESIVKGARGKRC